MKIGRRSVNLWSPERRLAAARLQAARRMDAWTELDPADLVERRRGTLVSVETDDAYLPHPGVVFEPHSASPLATHAALYFYEDDGQVIFVERMPLTWSEQIAQQVRAAS